MTPVQVKVPGKVMLSGEYAVLRGAPALAVTVDRWLTVTLSEDSARSGLEVTSDLWDHPETVFPQEGGAPSETGEPLVRAVERGLARTGIRGGSLTVRSQLDPRLGLGSSSALRLGVLAAFGAARGENTPNTWAREAFELQRADQAFASGYDVATQAHGGVCSYQPPSFAGEGGFGVVESVPGAPESLHERLLLFGGGRGAPTGPVGRRTLAWLDAAAPRATRLDQLSRLLTDAFRDYIAAEQPWRESNYERLVTAMAAHRRFFTETPAFPSRVGERLARLEGLDERWSWKPTGAGGEDLVLVLVREARDVARVQHALGSAGWQPFRHELTSEGLSWRFTEGAFASTLGEPEGVAEAPCTTQRH